MGRRLLKPDLHQRVAGGPAFAPRRRSPLPIANTDVEDISAAISEPTIVDCQYLFKSTDAKNNRSDPSLMTDSPNLHPSAPPLNSGFPRMVPCQAINLNRVNRWRPCCRLSLPRNQGLTATARDSFPSFFVGSKLLLPITNTAGEKDHLMISPPQLKWSKAFWTNGSTAASSRHSSLSIAGTHRRY